MITKTTATIIMAALKMIANPFLFFKIKAPFIGFFPLLYLKCIVYAIDTKEKFYFIHILINSYIVKMLY